MVTLVTLATGRGFKGIRSGDRSAGSLHRNAVLGGQRRNEGSTRAITKQVTGGTRPVCSAQCTVYSVHCGEIENTCEVRRAQAQAHRYTGTHEVSTIYYVGTDTSSRRCRARNKLGRLHEIAV